MTSRVLNTRNMQAKNAFENYINSDTKPDKTKLYWLLSVINMLASYIVGKKKQLQISLLKGNLSLIQKAANNS